MHSPTTTYVLLSALVASLGSATSVFLGPHAVFATPTHAPLLHLGGAGYRLELPFAAPTAATGAAIFPTQAPGTLLYFTEGNQQLLSARPQHSTQYSLQESGRYREQPSQGYPSPTQGYARISQDFQATQSPSPYTPETQDFPVSPQRQDYPTARTPENNVQNQNFAGRSSVQEFPVEDRRTPLAYSARPTQNYQDVQEERRVQPQQQHQQQQVYPDAQAGYARAPVSQSYLEGRRANEDFPESRPTPTPLAYSSPSAGYAPRPTSRTFQETSPAVQEYQQGYSPSPAPQAYSHQSIVPQAYARTSSVSAQGYSGEQFQNEVAVRQQFPESRALAVSRGYPISPVDLQQPQPHHSYSVNFEGAGFGYGYTVQRQQLTTPTPPQYGHAN